MRSRRRRSGRRNWGRDDPPIVPGLPGSPTINPRQVGGYFLFGGLMTPLPESEKVLILNFGAQYGQLIARRVREQNVFCQLVRHDLSAERIAELAPRGLIFSGGPASVYEPGAPHCDPALFDLNIPVLGICYGLQLACQALGGEVHPAPSREFGRADCTIAEGEPL